jgi:hypothetical protein
MSDSKVIEIPASPQGWQFPPCTTEGCNAREWEADVGLAPHPRGHAQAARCTGCSTVRMFLLRFVDGDDDDAHRPARVQAILDQAFEEYGSGGRPAVTADLVEWRPVMEAALKDENDRWGKRWLACAELWRHWRGRAHDMERQIDALQRHETQPTRIQAELIKASTQAEAAEAGLHAAQVEIASLRAQLEAAAR